MTDTPENEPPALASMDAEMKCCALTTPDGGILICHDKETYSPVYWVEYDKSDDSFTFIYKGGTVQPLGLKINKQMRENMSHGERVTIAHMVDTEIKSTQIALLIVKDY